jgi:hypothetical protein
MGRGCAIGSADCDWSGIPAGVDRAGDGAARRPYLVRTGGWLLSQLDCHAARRDAGGHGTSRLDGKKYAVLVGAGNPWRIGGRAAIRMSCHRIWRGRLAMLRCRNQYSSMPPGWIGQIDESVVGSAGHGFVIRYGRDILRVSSVITGLAAMCLVGAIALAAGSLTILSAADRSVLVAVFRRPLQKRSQLRIHARFLAG